MENKAFDDIELQAGKGGASKEKSTATAVAIKGAEEQGVEHHINDGPYAGMGKDALLKYSATMKWRIARWICIVILALGWFGMLAMAITIIVTTPKCLPWWQLVTFYEIYPRSFYDSDGDGIGDLKGITAKVDYLSRIGVGAILLTSIFGSSNKDFGNDVTDFTAIDEALGTMQDFEEMVDVLHEEEIKVVLDFIPNHSSDQHPWFLNKKKSKDYYIWREKKNNWVSLYGGSAWENGTHGYYLHQYSKYQPDLNFAWPAVQEELQNALEKWFIKGVDGFNLQSMKYLYESENFTDEPKNPDFTGGGKPKQYESRIHQYTAEYGGHSQGSVHDLLRRWRKEIFDQFSTAGTYRVMMTDSDSNASVVSSYYGTVTRPEADMPQNFNLLNLGDPLGEGATTKGSDIRRWIEEWNDNMPDKKWPNFMIGNHDIRRVASRMPPGYAAAANMLLLTLPGTPICYYGDEIGMTDVEMTLETTKDIKALNDPLRWRQKTRDPARSPMQWSADPNAGFSTNKSGTWLPVNTNYINGTNVEAMEDDNNEGTLLQLFKSLNKLRRNRRGFMNNNMHFVKDTDEVVSYIRETKDKTSTRYFVAINFGAISSEEDYFDVDPSLPIQGTIIIGTDPERRKSRGGRVEMNKLQLDPGEGLVIELDDVVEVAKGSNFVYEYFKPA
ncbi:amino acid transporter heavy chain SLC3A1-like [Amphiura filiformis]|uniref:amino acid transporter heavy chain SLC3A1-like n=1 Tax=Amphiura filiformis TaxID=82378 RepID=UPI003B212B2F